jgi:hemolysin activation/secretion protein
MPVAEGARVSTPAPRVSVEAEAVAGPDDRPPESPAAPGAESGGEEVMLEKPFYIRQYRVKGAKELPPVDVEGAVYPFMGPECTAAHVERARAALEKAYRDKGYFTVSVSVPAQESPPRHGIVKLEVSEARIGRLRVKGSRYFSLEKIKARVPSLAEGKLPNLSEVERDILALNRHPDRQVTPSPMRPGAVPGTMDVDLIVKDELPLHGSLELNNRNSPDTTDLRLNGAISYGNLWQAGHTLGLAFQIAPERIDDALVFSAYYTMPVPSVDGLSLTFTGIKQDSDINTLGGAGVAGRGYVIGGRANYLLPQGKSYFHSVSGGFDFKHFDQSVNVAEDDIDAPVDYFPFTVSYGGTHVAKTHSTDVNASVVFSLRGLGSSTQEFDARRYKADPGFVYLRADASHTHDLSNGMQWFVKAQGQVASGALVDSEQFAGGGLSNVRGYLESTVLGDNAIAGSVEFRSRSLIPIVAKEGETRPSQPNEWRFYVFCDGAYLRNYDPLPDQDSSFPLASVGLGSRVRFRDHFNGSVDAAVPLIDQGTSESGDVVVTFRMWSEF